jgi:hypothetical protein
LVATGAAILSVQKESGDVQALPPMGLGGFEPPTSWVRCTRVGELEVVKTWLFAALFLMRERRLLKMKYAGI